jgi:iron complex outermembrane receptor protein
MIKYRALLNSSNAAIALALVFAAAPAMAQSTLPPANPPTDATGAQVPPTDVEIVVTGSRIRRDPLSQDAPIVFVDQADIAKTGLNSTIDVLQRLPSSGGGTNSKFNNSGNLGNPPDGGGVGAGSAEIDLRYLGSKRTLVLVDGLRYVNGASASGVPGATDLNSIPEAMIERIEVLQDGASSIYGSDAIAGVVNIITKARQEGLVASAQLGGYDDGDGFTQNYQLSWGNGGDGPTQFVVGGNFVKQDGVRSRDRAISAFPGPYATSCLEAGCSGTPLLGRFRFFGNASNTVDDPATPLVNEDITDETLIAALPPGVAPVYPNDFRNFGAADAFNFAPFNFIQTPLKRLGLFANFRQELGENLNFSAKAVWNKRMSRNQAAPIPILIGQGAGNLNLLDTLDIDASNPFNPFDFTLNESNYVVVRRRMAEFGPRRFDQEVKTAYGVATLDGSFVTGGRKWYWDVNGSYGRNKADQVMRGNLNSDNLRIALGPVATCAATSGCVPFNIFGGAGTITQDMIDFVGFVQRDSSKQTSLDFTANITGSLFALPGGPFGVAAGVEYRKQKGRFDPDPIVAAGFSSDIPAQPTKGSFNVKEAYAEISAPLLADRPFADLLEVTGAVRYSDYSTSGSTTTFKAGANWKPIRDLRLRVNWAEGFRAPAIGELFGTFSRFDSAFDDPCSGNSELGRNITNDATVLANCTTQGGVGATTLPDDQLSVITGGNENLKPETSKSWVVGGVYSPSFIRRLSLEVNWYKITIDDAIQAFPAQLTVTNCVYNNDPTACDRITRAISGDIVGINSQLDNIAGIRTKGIDANLAYRTEETGFGRFGFTWNNAFLRNFDVLVPTAEGVQVISREGTEVGSPSQAYPKWKSTGIIDWDLRSFGASVTGRYIRSVRETNADNKIKSMFYTDAQLRWMLPASANNFGFALGVNNLFNVKAPGCFGCDVNGFDPTTYDIPGRYFYARASIKM